MTSKRAATPLDSTAFSRVAIGQGCAVYAGKQTCVCDSLESLFQSVVAEFSMDKNSCALLEITAQLPQGVWWGNAKNDSWRHEVHKRTDRQLFTRRQIAICGIQLKSNCHRTSLHVAQTLLMECFSQIKQLVWVPHLHAFKATLDRFQRLQTLQKLLEKSSKCSDRFPPVFRISAPRDTKSSSNRNRHCFEFSFKCFSNRRLLRRFRSGCHGLHVDTGRWEDSVHLDRKDSLCIVCRSSQQVEDEHHFLFDCPAYSSIQASHASLFQCACSVSDVFDSCEACGGFIRNCFSLRSNILTR